MTVDSIQNGIVIDHLTAGSAMKLYELLGLSDPSITVAIMKNVTSRKLGRKDIIKIDGITDIDLDVIGYVDPDATVNVIRSGELIEKKSIPAPERLVNVLRCKNPRRISTTEQELPQIFALSDRNRRIYRCIYCETRFSS